MTRVGVVHVEPCVDLLDKDRFEEFYAQALPIVYGYFLRRCRSVDAAEDLTQATFLSAVKSLQAGATVRSPMPWIVTIARRRLVDHFRTKGRDRRVQARSSTESDQEATDRDGASAEAIDLHEALHRVPATYRVALILRYVDDLPVADVAKQLSRSERAAESLLARARKALSAAYSEEQHE